MQPTRQRSVVSDIPSYRWSYLHHQSPWTVSLRRSYRGTATWSASGTWVPAGQDGDETTRSPRTKCLEVAASLLWCVYQCRQQRKVRHLTRHVISPSRMFMAELFTCDVFLVGDMGGSHWNVWSRAWGECRGSLTLSLYIYTIIIAASSNYNKE